MIFGKDFVSGDVLWYTSIRFSKNTFRIVEKTKPVEVIVLPFGDIHFAFFNNKDRTTIIRVLDEYKNYDGYLFNTKEDAITKWKSSILNKIDELQSLYEKKLEYLKKLLK